MKHEERDSKRKTQSKFMLLYDNRKNVSKEPEKDKRNQVMSCKLNAVTLHAKHQ